MPSDADFQMLYGNLKAQNTIDFWSTSFIRGTTLDKAIIIVDEFQNLNFTGETYLLLTVVVQDLCMPIWVSLVDQIQIVRLNILTLLLCLLLTHTTPVTSIKGRWYILLASLS